MQAALKTLIQLLLAAIVATWLYACYLFSGDAFPDDDGTIFLGVLGSMIGLSIGLALACALLEKRLDGPDETQGDAQAQTGVAAEALGGGPMPAIVTATLTFILPMVFTGLALFIGTMTNRLLELYGPLW